MLRPQLSEGQASEADRAGLGTPIGCLFTVLENKSIFLKKKNNLG